MDVSVFAPHQLGFVVKCETHGVPEATLVFTWTDAEKSDFNVELPYVDAADYAS